MGDYNYRVVRTGYEAENGVLQVAPISDPSTAGLTAKVIGLAYPNERALAQSSQSGRVVVPLTEAPFNYTWNVIHTTETYTIELSITQNNDAEGISLVAPARNWQFALPCDSDTLQDTIPILNPTDSVITITGVTVNVPGVNTAVVDYPAYILPNSRGNIIVSGSTQQGNTVGQGTIHISGVYTGTDDDLVNYTLNPSSSTDPDLPPGQSFSKQFVLTPTVFAAGTAYNVTLTNPDMLGGWITLNSAESQVIGGGDVAITANVTPPEWLEEGHTYAYSATVTLTDPDGGKRAGTLMFEVTPTGQEVELHTHFVPGPTPATEFELETTGTINAKIVTCDGGSGSGNGSTGSDGGGWSWSPLSGGGFHGTRPGSSNEEETGSNPVTGAGGTPAETTGEASQEIALGLSQNLMLEGESFQATLTLNSIVDQTIGDISVNLIISDTTGADARDNFTIIPAPPTGLGDLAAHGMVIGDWLIVPTVEVTRSEGVNFRISARIDYDYGGTSYTFTTIEKTITVFPAPELEITYELPEPSLVCTTFDLKATVANVGDGPARSVRFTSGQPQLTQQASGDPQGFRVVQVTLDGQVLDNPATGVWIGDIAPGSSSEIAWRFQTDDPGQFTSFSSDYQVANYQGNILAPSLRAINTILSETGGVQCVPSGPGNPGGPVYSISGQITDELGQPIEGVIVSSDARTNATTNASGVYTLTDLTEGTYNIIPATDGYIFSPLTQTVVLITDTAGIDFVGAEGETYSISGFVRDKFGDPVEGTVMSLDTGQNVTTNADGAYTLIGLITGTYTILPGEPQYRLAFLPETGSASVSSSNPQVENLDTTEYSLIGGIIWDPDGYPIPGVQVTLMGEGETRTYTTQRDKPNQYHFVDVPAPGSFTLTLEHSDYNSFAPSSPTTISLETITDKKTQDFYGSSGSYSISGQVTEASSDGPGIEGVVISAVSTANSLEDTTDSNGNYTIEGALDGYEYTVIPESAGYTFEPTSQLVPINGGDGQANFAGSEQLYSISGQVTWTESGNPIGGVTLEARQSGVTIGSATTDSATGIYQITGLPAGTYELSANRSGYTFVSAADRSDTIQVQVDAVNGNAENQNFIATYESPPSIPGTHALLGANFLRRVGEPGTNYSASGIGWNVETAKDFFNNSVSAADINDFREQGVETIIRLDTPDKIKDGRDRGDWGPLPADEISDAVAAGDCDAIEEWMEGIDNQYRNQLLGIEGVTNVNKFILGNEPNHSRDEWNYTAEEYAFVYNCYYDHWIEQEFEPGRPGVRQGLHALYVAGPGQEAGRVGYQWQDFLPSLFDNIAQADGYAMHVYGYYQNDENGNTLFRPWLDAILKEMDDHHVSAQPLLITEYNPGDDNIPPNPNPSGGDEWDDWFEQTYCWVQEANNAHNSKVRGLMYFADEPLRVAGRNPIPNEGWWNVSLRRWEDQRDIWLSLNGAACETNLPVVQSIQVQSTQNQQTNQIGGTISGTLGVWGENEVYYVTDNLEVPTGQTLTIVAGTTLVFDPGLRLDVGGQLLSDGNTANPIRFTSLDEAGWAGIHIQTSAVDNWCTGCSIENIQPGGVAIQVDGPLTVRTSRIWYVPGGTAINSTVPVDLSHTIIDYVDTGVHLVGTSPQSHTLTHLTINRCEHAIVNEGHNLTLENSILTTCTEAVSTKSVGQTTVNYTLFDSNGQNFVTETGAQLIQGPGILDAPPGFVSFPDDLTLEANSPAVNAADPQTPYDLELGYNGGRADLGAYGNTWRAPQQPPLAQMAVSLTTATPTLSGCPGQTLVYTLTLQNSGSVTDTYGLQPTLINPEFAVSFAQDYERAYRFIDLGPQEQTSIPVWVYIPFSSSLTSAYTFTIEAIGRYDVQAWVDLAAQITSFQEENGRVVIEAEHFAQNVERDGWSWQPETTLGGYVGEGYITARPDTDRQFITDVIVTSPELRYTINFTTTGTYYVWLRGYAHNGGGDSVYIGLDDASDTVLTGFTPRIWDWANVGTQNNPVTIEITQPGLHTFNLWQREDGIRLDRILLTTADDYTPKGDGSSESQTGSNP